MLQKSERIEMNAIVIAATRTPSVILCVLLNNNSKPCFVHVEVATNLPVDNRILHFSWVKVLGSCELKIWSHHPEVRTPMALRAKLVRAIKRAEGFKEAVTGYRLSIS